jgi:hypothetical protein
VKIARVNLEACVWGDGRFPHLERLLGYPPCRGHLAIARMAIIWGWQVEHYTPDAPCFHAPDEVVEMALEVASSVAVPALIRSRLGEETPEGLRMKGSSHEATGWLWRIRQKSAAGVEAKKAKRDHSNGNADNDSKPVVDPGLTTSEPHGSPQVNPLSSLLFDHPESNNTPRATRKRRSPRVRIETPYPDDFAPDDRHRALAVEHGLDVSHQHALFRSHHEAVGTVFKLWPSAFTKWLHIAAERNARAPRGRGPSGPTGMAATAEILRERNLIDPFAVTREKP